MLGLQSASEDSGISSSMNDERYAGHFYIYTHINSFFHKLIQFKRSMFLIKIYGLFDILASFDGLEVS